MVLATQTHGIFTFQSSIRVLAFFSLVFLFPKELRAENFKTVDYLAQEIAMTDYGREIFFDSEPVIADRKAIAQSCHMLKDLVLLGCNSKSRIFVLSLGEPELDGVMENTAAHEMLHVAYARLTSEERAHVDALTLNALKTITDKEILARLEKYGSGGENVASERHSILGTEVLGLPMELERYYAKYFLDRRKVVDFNRKYENKVALRDQSLKTYDQTLDILKVDIAARDKNLSAQAAELAQVRITLASLNTGHDDVEYNKLAVEFNSKAHDYNVGVKDSNDLIEKYKVLEKKRNDMAREGNRLAEAINGRS
jgi:hypothetical protein